MLRRAKFNSPDIAEMFCLWCPKSVRADVFEFTTPTGRRGYVVFWLDER